MSGRGQAQDDQQHCTSQDPDGTCGDLQRDNLQRSLGMLSEKFQLGTTERRAQGWFYRGTEETFPRGPHAVRQVHNRSNTSSCSVDGDLRNSSKVGHLPRKRKSRTKVQTFRRRVLAKVHRRRLERRGPLPSKQSKDGKGSGKTAEAVSAERRLAAKELARQKANFVRDLKIQRGKHRAHWHRLIFWVRGFGSGPLSLRPPPRRLRLGFLLLCLRPPPSSLAGLWALGLDWHCRCLLRWRIDRAWTGL